MEKLVTKATPAHGRLTPGDLILNPQLARDIPDDLIPYHMGELAKLLVRVEVAINALSRRLPVVLEGKTISPAGAGAPEAQSKDRYLKIPEVKQRLGLSLSHLYALIRAGDLPAKPLGRGGRGYRVLFSDLLVWEAKRSKDVDGKINKMLNSRYDRRKGSMAPPAA